MQSKHFICDLIVSCVKMEFGKRLILIKQTAAFSNFVYKALNASLESNLPGKGIVLIIHILVNYVFNSYRLLLRLHPLSKLDLVHIIWIKIKDTIFHQKMKLFLGHQCSKLTVSMICFLTGNCCLT